MFDLQCDLALKAGTRIHGTAHFLVDIIHLPITALKQKPLQAGIMLDFLLPKMVKVVHKQGHIC